MNKELILITSYCNTKEKKETLLSLLKNLQNFRDDYSILLCSHLPLDHFYYDYIDYFYYDKNNFILKSPKFNYNSWFAPFGEKHSYIIRSSYVEYGNTHAAILSMVIPGTKIAESLGYEKIHYLEYDSIIHKIDELKDNSKLLDTYDYVIYRGEKTHLLVGSIHSYKTKKIVDELKIFDIENIKSVYINYGSNIPENITFDMINNQRTYIVKKYEDLINNGIEVSKIRGNKYYWDVPFYEESTNSLLFISHNNNNENHDVKIIVNGNQIFNIQNLIPSGWRIIKLLDNFQDLQNIIVIRNNQIVMDLTFDEESRNEFLLYNKSVGILE
jgi:hypothetical protein